MDTPENYNNCSEEQKCQIRVDICGSVFASQPQTLDDGSNEWCEKACQLRQNYEYNIPREHMDLIKKWLNVEPRHHFVKVALNFGWKLTNYISSGIHLKNDDEANYLIRSI